MLLGLSGVCLYTLIYSIITVKSVLLLTFGCFEFVTIISNAALDSFILILGISEASILPKRGIDGL